MFPGHLLVLDVRWPLCLSPAYRAHQKRGPHFGDLRFFFFSNREMSELFFGRRFFGIKLGRYKMGEVSNYRAQKPSEIWRFEIFFFSNREMSELFLGGAFSV
jgi:hypothetical protein